MSESQPRLTLSTDQLIAAHEILASGIAVPETPGSMRPDVDFRVLTIVTGDVGTGKRALAERLWQAGWLDRVPLAPDAASLDDDQRRFLAAQGDTGNQFCCLHVRAAGSTSATIESIQADAQDLLTGIQQAWANLQDRTPAPNQKGCFITLPTTWQAVKQALEERYRLDKRAGSLDPNRITVLELRDQYCFLGTAYSQDNKQRDRAALVLLQDLVGLLLNASMLDGMDRDVEPLRGYPLMFCAGIVAGRELLLPGPDDKPIVVPWNRQLVDSTLQNQTFARRRKDDGFIEPPTSIATLSRLVEGLVEYEQTLGRPAAPIWSRIMDRLRDGNGRVLRSHFLEVYRRTSRIQKDWSEQYSRVALKRTVQAVAMEHGCLVLANYPAESLVRRVLTQTLKSRIPDQGLRYQDVVESIMEQHSVKLSTATDMLARLCTLGAISVNRQLTNDREDVGSKQWEERCIYCAPLYSWLLAPGRSAEADDTLRDRLPVPTNVRKQYVVDMAGQPIATMPVSIEPKTATNSLDNVVVQLTEGIVVPSGGSFSATPSPPPASLGWGSQLRSPEEQVADDVKAVEQSFTSSEQSDYITVQTTGDPARRYKRSIPLFMSSRNLSAAPTLLNRYLARELGTVTAESLGTFEINRVEPTIKGDPAESNQRVKLGVDVFSDSPAKLNRLANTLLWFRIDDDLDKQPPLPTDPYPVDDSVTDEPFNLPERPVVRTAFVTLTATKVFTITNVEADDIVNDFLDRELGVDRDDLGTAAVVGGRMVNVNVEAMGGLIANRPGLELEIRLRCPDESAIMKLDRALVKLADQYRRNATEPTATQVVDATVRSVVLTIDTEIETMPSVEAFDLSINDFLDAALGRQTRQSLGRAVVMGVDQIIDTELNVVQVKAQVMLQCPDVRSADTLEDTLTRNRLLSSTMGPDVLLTRVKPDMPRQDISRMVFLTFDVTRDKGDVVSASEVDRAINTFLDFRLGADRSVLGAVGVTNVAVTKNMRGEDALVRVSVALRCPDVESLDRLKRVLEELPDQYEPFMYKSAVPIDGVVDLNDKPSVKGTKGTKKGWSDDTDTYRYQTIRLLLDKTDQFSRTTSALRTRFTKYLKANAKSRVGDLIVMESTPVTLMLNGTQVMLDNVVVSARASSDLELSLMEDVLRGMPTVQRNIRDLDVTVKNLDPSFGFLTVEAALRRYMQDKLLAIVGQRIADRFDVIALERLSDNSAVVTVRIASSSPAVLNTYVSVLPGSFPEYLARYDAKTNSEASVASEAPVAPVEQYNPYGPPGTRQPNVRVDFWSAVGITVAQDDDTNSFAWPFRRNVELTLRLPASATFVMTYADLKLALQNYLDTTLAIDTNGRVDIMTVEGRSSDVGLTLQIYADDELNAERIDKAVVNFKLPVEPIAPVDKTTEQPPYRRFLTLFSPQDTASSDQYLDRLYRFLNDRYDTEVAEFDAFDIKVDKFTRVPSLVAKRDYIWRVDVIVESSSTKDVDALAGLVGKFYDDQGTTTEVLNNAGKPQEKPSDINATRYTMGLPPVTGLSYKGQRYRLAGDQEPTELVSNVRQSGIIKVGNFYYRADDGAPVGVDVSYDESVKVYNDVQANDTSKSDRVTQDGSAFNVYERDLKVLVKASELPGSMTNDEMTAYLEQWLDRKLDRDDPEDIDRATFKVMTRRYQEDASRIDVWRTSLTLRSRSKKNLDQLEAELRTLTEKVTWVVEPEPPRYIKYLGNQYLLIGGQVTTSASNVIKVNGYYYGLVPPGSSDDAVEVKDVDELSSEALRTAVKEYEQEKRAEEEQQKAADKKSGNKLSDRAADIKRQLDKVIQDIAQKNMVDDPAEPADPAVVYAAAVQTTMLTVQVDRTRLPATILSSMKVAQRYFMEWFGRTTETLFTTSMKLEVLAVVSDPYTSSYNCSIQLTSQTPSEILTVAALLAKSFRLINSVDGSPVDLSRDSIITLPVGSTIMGGPVGSTITGGPVGTDVITADDVAKATMRDVGFVSWVIDDVRRRNTRKLTITIVSVIDLPDRRKRAVVPNMLTNEQALDIIRPLVKDTLNQERYPSLKGLDPNALQTNKVAKLPNGMFVVYLDAVAKEEEEVEVVTPPAAVKLVLDSDAGYDGSYASEFEIVALERTIENRGGSPYGDGVRESIKVKLISIGSRGPLVKMPNAAALGVAIRRELDRNQQYGVSRGYIKVSDIAAENDIYGNDTILLVKADVLSSSANIGNAMLRGAVRANEDAWWRIVVAQLNGEKRTTISTENYPGSLPLKTPSVVEFFQKFLVDGLNDRPSLGFDPKRIKVVSADTGLKGTYWLIDVNVLTVGEQAAEEVADDKLDDWWLGAAKLINNSVGANSAIVVTQYYPGPRLSPPKREIGEFFQTFLETGFSARPNLKVRPGTFRVQGVVERQIGSKNEFWDVSVQLFSPTGRVRNEQPQVKMNLVDAQVYMRSTLAGLTADRIQQYFFANISRSDVNITVKPVTRVNSVTLIEVRVEASTTSVSTLSSVVDEIRRLCDNSNENYQRFVRSVQLDEEVRKSAQQQGNRVGMAVFNDDTPNTSSRPSVDAVLAGMNGLYGSNLPNKNMDIFGQRQTNAKYNVKFTDGGQKGKKGKKQATVEPDPFDDPPAGFVPADVFKYAAEDVPDDFPMPSTVVVPEQESANDDGDDGETIVTATTDGMIKLTTSRYVRPGYYMGNVTNEGSMGKAMRREGPSVDLNQPQGYSIGAYTVAKSEGGAKRKQQQQEPKNVVSREEADAMGFPKKGQPAVTIMDPMLLTMQRKREEQRQRNLQRGTGYANIRAMGTSGRQLAARYMQASKDIEQFGSTFVDAIITELTNSGAVDDVPAKKDKEETKVVNDEEEDEQFFDSFVTAMTGDLVEDTEIVLTTKEQAAYDAAELQALPSALMPLLSNASDAYYLIGMLTRMNEFGVAKWVKEQVGEVAPFSNPSRPDAAKTSARRVVTAVLSQTRLKPVADMVDIIKDSDGTPDNDGTEAFSKETLEKLSKELRKSGYGLSPSDISDAMEWWRDSVYRGLGVPIDSVPKVAKDSEFARNEPEEVDVRTPEGRRQFEEAVRKYGIGIGDEVVKPDENGKLTTIEGKPAFTPGIDILMDGVKVGTVKSFNAVDDDYIGISNPLGVLRYTNANMESALFDAINRDAALAKDAKEFLKSDAAIDEMRERLRTALKSNGSLATASIETMADKILARYQKAKGIGPTKRKPAITTKNAGKVAKRSKGR